MQSDKQSDKQSQCCVCLFRISKLSKDIHEIHSFSCCVGVMHQECYKEFCKSTCVNQCPYCRKTINNSSNYRIDEIDEIDEIDDEFISVLDFMF